MRWLALFIAWWLHQLRSLMGQAPSAVPAKTAAAPRLVKPAEAPVPGATVARVLDRVRAHARLHALWMAELWRLGQSSPDQGLAITAGETGRLLTAPADQAAARAAFLASDPTAKALAPTAAAADAALANDAGWTGFCEDFGLSPPAADLMALALAVAWEPDLGRVLAYLQDDGQALQPSRQLAARLFDNPEPLDAAPLLAWRLAQPLNGAAPDLPATCWAADPAVAVSLAEGSWRDPLLDGGARLVSPEGRLPLHQASLATLQAVAASDERPLVIDLCGAEGLGRQTLAARFAAGRGQALLALDAALLLGRPNAEPQRILAAGHRMARALGAIPYWRGADRIAAADWLAVSDTVDLALRGWPAAGPFGPAAGKAAITLEPLHTSDRLALWSQHSPAEPPRLVALQRLTAGEVVAAALAAPIGPGAVRAALRRSAPPQDDLLNLVPTPYVWDDLVAPPELERQLREFADQIRLRWAVYEDWGFERLTPMGRGLAALFGGASGLGKTMAAQVIARELDLDLYRVDLAGVVDKYVGETEKRLRSVFDYCERAGCILFFDEADALFGKRTQVKDAHDRFANIEIDYLLQRIEAFNGVTILATNRKSELDSAFLRRLRLIIDFLPPGEDERLALWKKALLPQSPTGEDLLDGIDWAFLAGELSMNGAEIKATALGAAFLAKADGGRIAMPHVLAAAQRELSKQGIILRTPLEAGS
ncbi:hypothetical protein QO010_002188 [Caulobacter ginsengisoli]|uniref:AAA+ ATPase domain-containing protein n=1 Tax=Caulobacter ginsengisoli TaxID=400775 RepID=A0ABU0IQW2_9CAUL|nr:ATP-binding protein [Caulobacter ginsengisoli]MDQ0464407.1 hypothetical protein [Caulobacter ginsengisoli]